MNAEQDKALAARAAADLVQPGMVVGLGHGSTARYAIIHLGTRLASGELRNIRAIPCSAEVLKLARDAGIPLVTLDTHPSIDLTIDGADEVAPDLTLIKGAGGALTHEKIVAQASRREIIAVDHTKLVERTGARALLPVEVIPFARATIHNFLESLGAAVILRLDPLGNPFTTAEGNLILDTRWAAIKDPPTLSATLDSRAGIVTHGLFLGLATMVIVAEEGQVRHLTPA